MAMKLAAGALARDARMVLRLLSKPGARLAETGSGRWVIESNARRGRGQTIEAAIVRELAGRDWLIKEPSGSYRISVAGERWLAGAWKAGQDASPAERFADQHRAGPAPRTRRQGRLAAPCLQRGGKPARLAQESPRQERGAPHQRGPV